jgi:hypothetical protein
MSKTGSVIMKTVISLAMTACPCLPQAKSGGATAAKIQPLETSLAKPIDWGIYKARLFKNVESNMKFTLQTSWIPGENHKGMFRYKMSAIPDMAGLHSDDEIEALMKRVNACLIRLNLFDVDEFLLRSLSVSFSFGVDDKAHVRNLFANAASQMDANEYRQFVGGNKSGSWSISWVCSNE